MAIELSQEEFQTLENDIKKLIYQLEILQRMYEKQTGSRYKPFYLTDPVNQATLSTKPGGDAKT